MGGVLEKMKQHYHFIGIGGIGMGAIASLLLAKGAHVSGSDLKENQMTKSLQDQGAKIFFGHDGAHVEGSDYVIYSSAVKFDNPEMVAAKAKNIPVLQRAQLLAKLMEDHIGVTVAGAHGKTTTTSMASSLLIKAGLQPTTAVGGIINGTTTNARLGIGKYFVAETDESDGTFLYFHPTYSIVTNIDFEHVDYYHNLDNIIEAYRKFIHGTNPQGIVIGCAEDKRLLKLLQESARPYVTYGVSSSWDYWAKDIHLQGIGAQFVCFYKDQKLGTVDLNVPGEHNVLNALAVVALGSILKIDFKIIQQALKEYKGVQRRFQIIGQGDNIIVIDDYAHHPTEIQATLKAARNLGHKRIVAVFQPHRYSRFQSLWEEFAESLKSVDHLVIADIYAASEKPIDGLTSEKFAQFIVEKGCKSAMYLKKESIVEHLLQEIKSGDCVLTLGAGDVTKISYELAQALKSSVIGRINQ
jgi:UDP-N-acetylmuramate--alanine ligase